MTQIVRDPDFYEPGEEDDCSTFSYFCQTHDRYYRYDGCGDGAHLIAPRCDRHGLENMWPQPLMMAFPEGFSPSLSDAQLAWVRSEEDAC
ncbi:hypothetical protein ACF06V_11580 [Streptomyces bobili]|uniref:hypothetical protein n=1 Tax=Streptomyces bobili TaxID=67280 RepID=UPI0036F9654B